MNDEETLRKQRKKKQLNEEWEYDPDSEYPVHEKYPKEEPVKKG